MPDEKNLLRRKKSPLWIWGVQVLFLCLFSACASNPRDQYTTFLISTDLMRANDTTKGTFSGIGMYISKIKSSDNALSFIQVISLIEGAPGCRAGIKQGDIIVSINGESTEGLTVDEAMARLRGWSGSSVNLIIQRGENPELPVSIKRSFIEVPTVRYSMIENIGYMKILTFTPNTPERAVDAINYFKRNNYNSIIIDLRNNRGGLLKSAVEVAGLFLEGGVVARTKSRIPIIKRVYNTRRISQVPSDIPIVVLINSGSASGSELVAGALRDRGRAYLVGENSYGKGSIQNIVSFGVIGFRVTTAYYYTPNNINIDQVGLMPDYLVIFPEFNDTENENDIQLHEAINILNNWVSAR
jgi:carboxyl-terminal processing protease